MLEIRPANLAQVVSYKGKMVQIADDVSGVAQQLREIDANLKLIYAAEAKPPYWIVRHDVDEPDGSVTEHLVFTSTTLEGLVERVMRIAADDYDYAAELAATDAKAAVAEDERFAAQRAPILEKLEHAFRKDLGIQRNF